MKYATYAVYSFATHEQGEILSIHATYDAACKKIRWNGFAGVCEVHDSAKRGEDILKHAQGAPANRRAKTKFATYAFYSFAAHEQGEILSIHATYDAACKKTRWNSFAGVCEVYDSAKRGEDIRKHAW